ncbi:MAG: TolC family protein [Saprospiraceae bacterium]
MRTSKLLFFLMFFGGIQCVVAQNQNQPEAIRLTLPEVIAMSQSEAPDVLLAKTRLTNSYWQYQSFLGDYRPQISLEATLPNLERSIIPFVQPDGRDVFIRKASVSSSFSVALRQDVALTGGQVFASTGLQHKYNFANDLNPAINSYFSTPISVGFNQPLFGFNALKWNKRIEPLRYQQAGKEYAENMERLAFDASRLYFDVLIAQKNAEAATLEKVNADTLYAISQGRFSVGRIAETELLQIELSVMNANASQAEAMLRLQTATEELRNFLGIREAINFDLATPDAIPAFLIDPELALQYAKTNRSTAVAFQRRLLEADRNVAEAKANNGLNANLFGTFGLSQTSEQFDQAYVDPLDQEQLRLGLQLPIADWGKSKARLQIAESNRKLVQMNVSQERINFEREILLKVQQFDLVREQVERSLRAYEVAQRSEDITRKRYRIGKISITDLNISISAKESARRRYITSLQSFWLSHFELRNLTLYDFESGKPLVKTLNNFDN